MSRPDLYLVALCAIALLVTMVSLIRSDPEIRPSAFGPVAYAIFGAGLMYFGAPATGFFMIALGVSWRLSQPAPQDDGSAKLHDLA